MADDDHESIQHLVDTLFRGRARVSRLDAIMQAQALDLDEDILSIVELLPPVSYTRDRLADQINSALVGHGWNKRFGTVD